ncbi:MAG: hypothetical protein ACHQ53_06165 [Polyangiales bacterium]
MTRASSLAMLCALLVCGGACKGKVAPAKGNGSGGSASPSGGSAAKGVGGSTGSGGSGSAVGTAGSSGAGGSRGDSSGSGGGAGSSGSGDAGSNGQGGSSGGGGTGGSTTPDAGSPDAGQFGVSCKDGTYLLCEDFEATAVNSIPTGWTKHGDPVAVADDQAVSGTHSLKIGPTDNGERRIYHDAMMLPTTHFGRVRFKVQTPVPDAFVHSTMVAFSGHSPKPDMDNLEVRVVDTVKESKQGFNNDGNGSHFQVLYNVQPQSRGEFAHGSSYDWKFDDAWHCAEWYIDSAQQAYEFWLDGQEIKSIEFMNGAGNYDNTEVPSMFGELRLGWNNYQSAPPGFTAWLDDFAMADKRIGCP